MTIDLRPITNSDDVKHFSGTELLAYVQLGRRGKHFGTVVDEIDRRVTNRTTTDRPLTVPIVEALAILDKRKVPHCGPKAVDAVVLTVSEKAVAHTEAEAREAVIADAGQVAEVIAERLCTQNDKGYKANLRAAKRIMAAQ